MSYSNKQIQQKLNELGFGPIEVNGVIGPATDAAVVAFKKKNGLNPRPYIGPLTLQMLFDTRKPVLQDPSGILPWDAELKKHLGMSEITNNKALREWLRSDGATLGDPAKLPWCGDTIETAIRLGLPDEWAVTDKTLRANPYWALNWALLGVESELAYGCIVTFKRPGGGHVAELIGIDPKRKMLRVRGGNQANSVSDTFIAQARMFSCRKPSTWAKKLPPLPVMDSAGKIISTNEA